MLRWHRDFSERIRIKLKLSHYAVYWICWLEGVLTVLLIWWIITLISRSKHRPKTACMDSGDSCLMSMVCPVWASGNLYEPL